MVKPPCRAAVTVPTKAHTPAFVSTLPPTVISLFCPPPTPTQVEKKLLKAGVIEPPPQQRDDSDDEGAALRLRTVRHGMHRQRRTESDEDSDFD
mgnify:CR=1 FL=1